MGRFNLAAAILLIANVDSFSPQMSSGLQNSQLNMADKPAGSFFHQVPDDNESNDEAKGENPPVDFDGAVSELLRSRKKAPRASEPSTIKGVPTAKATGTSNSHVQNIIPKHQVMFVLNPFFVLLPKKDSESQRIL